MPTKTYKKKLLDARPDRLDLRDREYRPPLISLPDAWPKEKDYEELIKIYKSNHMILDQGTDGACTGFGLAAVINYLFLRDMFDNNDGVIDTELMQHKQVSSKMLYNMARIYDEWDGEDYEGSSCRGAMKGWHRHGVCKKETWPHNPSKEDTQTYPLDAWSEEAVDTPLGAYYRINKDSVVDMQSAIKEVGAIYCSAMIQKGWWLDTEASLPIIEHTADKIGGHAFAIVGYNKDGFIIQNSWGNTWGYNGFAILSYKEWVENGSDAWVAVRGAALNRSASPHTFSNHSLQTIGSDFSKEDASVITRALGYPYNHTQIAPWSEEEAYKHTLVIGNDGRPKLTMIAASTPEQSAEIICHTNVKKWMMESTKNRRVVIYAHGGLNNEEDSINRIRVMAPYFKANGIYPIFITWKTGFMESISNQIQDKVHDIFFGAGIEPSSTRARGMMDKLKDAIDSSIESFARKIMVKGIWSEMKENAKFASDRAVPAFSQHGSTKAGGMVILAKELEKLKGKFNCEIHLVGHSAGSILFGYWMEELTKRKLSIDSLTLYAPACTLGFANKYYINAAKKNIFTTKETYIHVMDDERERADDVAIYKKSLLYLVSRALEDIHKMPLLGMAAAWDLKYTKEKDIFNTVKYPDIKRWSDFAKDINYTAYTKDHSQVKTSLKNDYTELAHGSFDNDIQVIEETIKRIASAQQFKYNVENLNGY